MHLIQLDDDLFVSGQLTPEDIQAAAQYGIRTIINNRPDYEDPWQVENAVLEEMAKASGIDYYYLPFSGMPPADVIERMVEELPAMRKPLLAFCRSGTRSAGLLNLAATRMRGR